MVKKWEVTVSTLPDSGKRRVYVCLPQSYRAKGLTRYPVMYMFDGHNVFFDSDATYGKSWGMKQYMERSKKRADHRGGRV